MIDFESAPTSGGGFKPKMILGGAQPAGEQPDYIKNLNDRQREAALITEGPLIVLAGAGSGKTKMLTSRIAYLIDACQVPAHHILAVTFTNKAAQEMRERVGRMLQSANTYGFGSPEIGTFHAICVRILRREISHTPFTKPFVIYDDSDQLTLIKGVVNKLGIDDKAYNPKAIQGTINRLKCDAIEPQEMEPAPHNIFERQVKRVYEQYQKDLFSNNALDFGEILTMTYRLFRDHIEVRNKYQHRFRYIHVDEYQDTNRAQYLLLSMLAKKSFGGHENICVVGDEDQSIYKWRGADIRNILEFESDYPAAKVVKLEQNYRSTKSIITAASEVIKNNRERKDKTLWTDNEEGLPIYRFQLPDERAEAELTVSEIKRLAANEGYTYNDFAIFYRTHAQSRQYEDLLRREKIPYQIVGGLRFYDRKEIKDILSYFKVILNASDSISLKRIINVPGRGIGKTTIDKLDELHTRMQIAGEHEATFWSALQRAAQDPSITSAGTAKKLAGFVKLMERLMVEQPKLLLSELYHLILDEIGYVRELRQEGTDESMARIENLEEFDSLLQEFEEDFFENIPDSERETKKTELLPVFIEQSSLAAEVETANNQAPQVAVKLMTLHSSKGLEFPVVFLGGMEEGLFPSVKPWEETPEDEIEEERRLCYVGMTRARQILYLMNVVVRRIWGQISYQEPARFFNEIPDRLIEFKDLSYGGGAGGGSRFRAGSSRQMSGYSVSSSSGSSSEADVDMRPRTSQKTQDRFEYSQLSPEEGLVGMKLDHPDYGLGTIVAAEGKGEDQKIQVEFKNRNLRKFMFKYVKQYLEA